MKILIISDTHLKPWIFDQADTVIKYFHPDKIVILGDYVDDWNASIDKYEAMMSRCIKFAKDHPDAIWLWGNHDISYLIAAGVSCSGHYSIADTVLPSLFNKLERETTGFKFVHYEDGVFFSHGGICSAWMRAYTGDLHDFEKTAEWLNNTSFDTMWYDLSPVWYRPSDDFPPYTYGGITQIIGHTPAKRIAKWKNMIFTDVFSTYRDTGAPIGTQEFLLYDTTTKSGTCIHAKTLATKDFKE